MGARSLVESLIREHFGIENGVLTVGGIAVARLAEEHGTPLYVYDAEVFRRRFETLRRHLPTRVQIYYSVKANPNPEVVRRFVELGAGTEIASGGEYRRARRAGCLPEKVVFAGPGKSAEELELVVREGIGEIHIESGDEMDRLASIADRLDREVPVAIRVNPGEAASGGAMRMGGQPAAFGFDEELLEEVVRDVRACPRLRLAGIHMFAGTQILDAATLVGQWRHAAGIAGQLAAMTGEPVSTVDLGGGLGIPYFPNESALDLDAVQELSEALFRDLEHQPALAKTRFILEPGRFLSGPGGVYLARVVSVKDSRGSRFVILDGGMNHHLAASGNLGQVIKRDYPIVNATRLDERHFADAKVVGPLCTPLDTLGRQTILPETCPGDLVAVLQSGAYGLTASPVGFLSHPMPAEVLVKGGQARQIRERGSIERPLADLP